MKYYPYAFILTTEGCKYIDLTIIIELLFDK